MHYEYKTHSQKYTGRAPGKDAMCVYLSELGRWLEDNPVPYETTLPFFLYSRVKKLTSIRFYGEESLKCNCSPVVYNCYVCAKCGEDLISNPFQRLVVVGRFFRKKEWSSQDVNATMEGGFLFEQWAFRCVCCQIRHAFIQAV